MVTITESRTEGREGKSKKSETFTAREEVVRPLSKKAQEAKIFLERNPVPKEFLKS